MLLVIWKSSRAQPSSIRTSFSSCIQCFYLLGSLLGGKGLLALVLDLLRLHIPSQHACSSFQDPPDGSSKLDEQFSDVLICFSFLQNVKMKQSETLGKEDK